MSASKLKWLLAVFVSMFTLLAYAADTEDLAEKKARYSTAAGCLGCHQSTGQHFDEESGNSDQAESAEKTS